MIKRNKGCIHTRKDLKGRLPFVSFHLVKECVFMIVTTTEEKYIDTSTTVDILKRYFDDSLCKKEYDYV